MIILLLEVKEEMTIIIQKHTNKKFKILQITENKIIMADQHTGTLCWERISNLGLYKTK